MNNPVTNLVDAAWSKMEALSTMRSFIQNELNHHPDSLPIGFTAEKRHHAPSSMDGFSGKSAYFLRLKNTQPDLSYLEDQFDELDQRYHCLMQELERIVN